MKGLFSQRSPFMQFLLLVFLTLGGLLFFTSVGIMLGSLIFPYSVSEILSQGSLSGGWADTDVLMFLQGFSTLGTFLMPGLIGAWLISPHPSAYLGINSFPKRGLLVSLLVLVITVSGTTISDALYRFSSNLALPEWLQFAEGWLRGSDAMMAEQMQTFLAMDNLIDFSRVFFLLAFLPAVAEETLFRGALQPILKRGFGNRHLAIWVTAVLFALLHQQFNAFLSIMALGAVLGYLREWSGSLWVPVLMHLINNGLIVILVYFFDMPYLEVANLSDEWQWYLAIPGLLVFVVGLVVLRRKFLPG